MHGATIKIQIQHLFEVNIVQSVLTRWPYKPLYSPDKYKEKARNFVANKEIICTVFCAHSALILLFSR